MILLPVRVIELGPSKKEGRARKATESYGKLRIIKELTMNRKYFALISKQAENTIGQAVVHA